MNAALIRDPDRPTSVKTRYMSGWQQLLCVDTELGQPAPPEISRQIIDASRAALPDAGAMVLSDYGRGALDRKALAEELADIFQKAAQ